MSLACGAEVSLAPASPTSLPEIDPTTLPVVRAELGMAPRPAPPVHRDYPARVVAEIEVREVVKEIADGVQYTFWTFGGSVPGPMIRVRRGDLVELHLMNHPDNTMPHNIDLHAVTGPGGGAASTFTAPGHRSQFTFRALNTGVYMYHCATAPVGMHVANGMYGMIVIEPEEGWRSVEREYYVVQGDFYTRGNFREPGHQPFDMERAIDEDPSYVLFNGREGSLAGDDALRAEVGETVRLFLGNGGPNLVSSFHVIGEIFDVVHPEGSPSVQRDVQTTLIPAGGSAVVEFQTQVPGSYVLVDHSLFRAFHKGTIGMLEVSGPANRIVYSGRQKEAIYRTDSDAPGTTPAAMRAGASDAGDDSPAARRARGLAVYRSVCATCHQPDGEGMGDAFPPLAGSDYLMDKERSIQVVLAGLSGPVVVNGKTYDGVMPPLAHLADREIADVLTFVRSSFGNRGDAVRDEDVALAREALRGAQKAERP
ncbi:MAG: nitrite reductase, copper-containing [Proteobacteria bacterium]|nr:MAG: nitrite reductase, copper-containing [Pseudomonadota bacterium]